MKKKVYSVEKLKEVYQGTEELKAYPVKSMKEEDTIFSGFYIGTLPVFDSGYGLEKRFDGLYFRGDFKNSELVPVKPCIPHSHTFLDDFYYLTLNREYFLSISHTQNTLLRFGFTKEQLELSEVFIEVPINSQLTLTEKELTELFHIVADNPAFSDSLSDKIKEAYNRPVGYLRLKNELERSAD